MEFWKITLLIKILILQLFYSTICFIALGPRLSTNSLSLNEIEWKEYQSHLHILTLGSSIMPSVADLIKLWFE